MSESTAQQTTQEATPSEFRPLTFTRSVRATTVAASWLASDQHRLDAGYYATEVFEATRTLKTSKHPIGVLRDFVDDIYLLGRFKRVYSDAPSGWPYLSASEAFHFRPEPTRYLAKTHAPRNSDRFFARKGWLLISASGTLGRICMASGRLENFFLTHDLIRIVPNDQLEAGYIYAFLSSRLGQALLKRDQYGSAIKHLEQEHVAALSIPIIPTEHRRRIDEYILLACELREEANRLLDQADELIYMHLDLPRLHEEDIEYFMPELSSAPFSPGHPNAFRLLASELEDRLDASYHRPVATLVKNRVASSRHEVVSIAEIAEKIVVPPRFRRIYVPDDQGVPFLRPSDLVTLRPERLRISKLTPELSELELHEGEVLISTDGTVGRVSVVSPHLAGWAGSNNLARVSLGEDKSINGYLAAFLATPYGFHQLSREVYGGVVDHIDASHIGKVLIPLPPPKLQTDIGSRVISAFELKDRAVVLEDRAVAMLEDHFADAGI